MEGYGNENPGAFQPTRPLRGATAIVFRFDRLRHDFNPRAPCGARPATGWRAGSRRKISTHAPLAGRDDQIPRALAHAVISTHAPLAGRDVGERVTVHTPAQISTHAPLAGRDIVYPKTCASTRKFQPTRPLRGATGAILAQILM